MENKDQFNQLFKNADEQLSQSPSAQAWKRLDHQLQKDHSPRIVPFRIWAVAASLLVLVGAFFFINTPQDKEQIADKNGVIQEWESIQEVNSSSLPVHLSNQKSARALSHQKIEEGQQGKRLLVSRKVFQQEQPNLNDTINM